MNPARVMFIVPQKAQSTSDTRAGFTASFLLALALVGLVGLAGGGCVLPAQAFGEEAPAKNEQNTGAVGKVEAALRAEIAALKQEMESQQTTTQSGIFNFAKTTNSALLSGGSVMFAMLSIVHVVLYLGYRIVTRMIPLINADDHSALDITPGPGFGSDV